MYCVVKVCNSTVSWTLFLYMVHWGLVGKRCVIVKLLMVEVVATGVESDGNPASRSGKTCVG